MTPIIGHGIFPWWMEPVLYAIVYAPFWLPVLIVLIALAVWLRRRK